MAQRPTPQSIAICTLIALHSDPSSPLHEIDFNPGHRQDDLGIFLEQCVIGGSLSSDDASSTTVMNAMMKSNDASSTYIQSRTKLSNRWIHDMRQKVGDKIVNLLLNTLNMASESLDAFMDLMESLRGSISEGIVDSVSAHGIFLRKVSLGFEELPFESASLLWHAFKEELAESQQELTEDDSEQVQMSTCASSTHSQWHWPRSEAQIEAILRDECIDLQQGRSFQNLSYEEMELEIRRLLNDNPELPSAYFLRFLNCIQHGERVGALEALHQYFDYAMIQYKNPKEILQFAAILLASTHDAFGDTALSMLATDEAVRVAQQSKDASCVAFALGWLYKNNNLKSNCDGSGVAGGGELLRRCATRATQGQLRPLVAGANFSLVQHYLEEERSTPARAWNTLLDASTDPATDNLPTLDRPTHMTNTSQEAMQCLARQRLVSAGIWDSFGVLSLSGLSSYVALHCHGQNQDNHLLSTDKLTAIQNVARAALYGSHSNLLSHESTMSFGCDSENKQRQQKDQPSSPSCIYASSLRQLFQLRERFQLGGATLDNLFLHNVVLLLHEWAVRRGDLNDAQAFGIVLETDLHPRLANHTQAMVDVFMQKCLLLSRQGQWEKARGVARRLITICENEGLKTHHARILIQLAVIQLESNPHQFIAALPPLLEGLSMCERCEMDGLHATALSILAKVFLRLRNPKRAMAILRAALSCLLRQEHVWFQAEAFLTLAKSHLQLASVARTEVTANNHNKKQKKQLRAAAKELQNSYDLFQQCHDFIRLQEIFYLQARVYASLEKVKERDAASKRFLEVSKYLQTAASDCPSKLALDSLGDFGKLDELVERSVPFTT